MAANGVGEAIVGAMAGLRVSGAATTGFGALDEAFGKRVAARRFGLGQEGGSCIAAQAGETEGWN